MDDEPLRKSRGKVRDEGLRQTILHAAAEMLLEAGYHGFTMEGVSARAGASKVTLYRWWPSKGALAMDAYVHSITDSIAFPTTDSPRQDVENQLAFVIEGLTSSRAGRAIRELIGAAQTDPVLKADLAARYIEPRRELAAVAFARLFGWNAVERRQDLNLVTDQVYGAIYNRLLFGLEPLDRNFARQVLDFWAPGPIHKGEQP